MHAETPAVPPSAYFLRAFWAAAGGDPALPERVVFTGDGASPSAFAVTDFAAAAVGAAGLAVAELIASGASTPPGVTVDRRLAAIWFGTSLRPDGWTLPPLWDAVAGDYLASDGWIRLHTNAPHHRAAALAALGMAQAQAGRDAVSRAVSAWRADDLEAAVVARGGCAAAMRSAAQWAAHSQGGAVRDEPLLHIEPGPAPACATAAPWSAPAGRPLRGIRVLDLTRILAGPVATRFLAGYGAEVLRVDPPGWEEPGTVPEVVLGKRCARLDLKTAAGRRVLETLLAGADVLVHGYRPGALEALGLDAARRRRLNPALIDVSLDAYGWSGPWAGRRGYDSLVQMSTGIADAGMRAARAERPVPLPMQALDHATGYLMACAAVRGLTLRRAGGGGVTVRASLARTAALLASRAGPAAGGAAPSPEGPEDLDPAIEHTAWGPARRVLAPLAVAGAPLRWDLPAGALGSSGAAWR